MHHIIFDIIAAHQDIAYGLVFLFLFFEGDALLFGIAFLAHQGVLSLGVLIPLVFIGALAADSTWYVVGRQLQQLWPWLHSWMERFAGPLDRHLLKSPERTLTLARFTYGGVCRATVMRAGSLGIPYGRFLLATIRAVLIWMIVVGGIGYASSIGLSHAARYLRFAEVAFMVAVVLFLFVEHRVARRVRGRM